MSRIYVVIPTNHLPKESKARLIKADTPAQAIRFATKDYYGVTVADAETCVDLASNGTKVEDATV